MNKFESKAKEILSEVENILDKKSKGIEMSRYPGTFFSATNDGFWVMLLRIQTLLYLYDPNMPLYLRSLRISESVNRNYMGSEFEEVKDLLEVFLEMLKFQEAEN